MRRLAAVAVLLSALTPSAWLAWRSRDMPHLGYFHDDSVYWVCARSLAQGEGYRIASLPRQPYQTKYPPLYPLLLAGVWKLAPAFPANLPWAALVAWLMLPAWLLLARIAVLDLGIDRSAATALCAFLALNPFAAICSISLLSELPFAGLLLGSLALVERARRPEGSAALAAAAGVAGAAACLVRSAALPLLAAGLLTFLMRRQYRRAAAFSTAMLPAIVAWNVWAWLHQAKDTNPATLYYTNYLGFYTIPLRDLGLLAWKNLDSLVSGIGGLLVFNLGDSFAGKTAARLLAAAALAGTVRLWRRGRPAAVSFCAMYLAPLLLWHYPPDQRFVLPVFPILLAGFWTELRNLLDAAKAHRARLATATVLGVVGAFAAFQAGTAFTRVLPGFVEQHRRALAQTRPAYRWIAEHVPAGAGVLAYQDAMLYLHTGRHACRLVIRPGIFYRGNRQALDEILSGADGYARQHGLSYVVLTPSDLDAELGGADRRDAQRTLRANSRLERLYDSAAASVYRLK